MEASIDAVMEAMGDEADWDLARLARARRLGDWMFEQVADLVCGSVAEVGAGIGTFSDRILADGAERMLLVEPWQPCVAADSGLELTDLYRSNLLGIPGWWVSSKRGSAEIGARARRLRAPGPRVAADRAPHTPALGPQPHRARQE